MHHPATRRRPRQYGALTALLGVAVLILLSLGAGIASAWPTGDDDAGDSGQRSRPTWTHPHERPHHRHPHHTHPHHPGDSDHDDDDDSGGTTSTTTSTTSTSTSATTSTTSTGAVVVPPKVTIPTPTRTTPDKPTTGNSQGPTSDDNTYLQDRAADVPTVAPPAAPGAPGAGAPAAGPGAAGPADAGGTPARAPRTRPAPETAPEADGPPPATHTADHEPVAESQTTALPLDPAPEDASSVKKVLVGLAPGGLLALGAVALLGSGSFLDALRISRG